jgi:hypothetical protein
MHDSVRATIVHSLPGRLRLRLLDRSDASAAIEAALCALPHVTQANASSFTGSVLIHHRVSADSLIAEIEKAGLVRIEPVTPPALGSERAGPGLPPLSPLGLVFLALALWQISRGQILPPALTLLWYSGLLPDTPAPQDSAHDGQE